jgi:hypothetical protein
LANSATAAGYNNYYHFPVVAFNASIQIALLALFTALSEAAYRRVPSIPAASPWRPERLVSNASPAWLLAVSALVVLALEPWSFGAPPRIALGAPTWVWRSAASCAGLALAFALWRKPKTAAEAETAGRRRPNYPDHRPPEGRRYERAHLCVCVFSRFTIKYKYYHCTADCQL